MKQSFRVKLSLCLGRVTVCVFTLSSLTDSIFTAGLAAGGPGRRRGDCTPGYGPCSCMGDSQGLPAGPHARRWASVPGAASWIIQPADPTFSAGTARVTASHGDIGTVKLVTRTRSPAGSEADPTCGR